MNVICQFQKPAIAKILTVETNKRMFSSILWPLFESSFNILCKQFQASAFPISASIKDPVSFCVKPLMGILENEKSFFYKDRVHA